MPMTLHQLVAGLQNELRHVPRYSAADLSLLVLAVRDWQAAAQADGPAVVAALAAEVDRLQRGYRYQPPTPPP